MKTVLALITVSLIAGAALAAEKITAGPKGGKMLNATTEFYVENDRTVTLAFYDANLKPVPVNAQTAVIWADAKTGRVKLDTEKKGDALVSTKPLPAGDGYNVMVQLKPAPDAKAQNFKVALKLNQCPACKRAEYACTCDKHDDHDHNAPGHKH